MIYRRFRPEGLANLNEKVDPAIVRNAALDAKIWNQRIIPFTLPPPLSLMMGDVCGGSSSVSMAKAVLEWRRRHESGTIWNSLADCNRQIAVAFQDIEAWNVKDSARFTRSVEAMALQPLSDWGQDPILSRLLTIKQLFRTARQLLKQIGEEAGVDIEPDSQTALSDATDAIPGVLCAGVPGAGGVDAIFCIVSHAARGAVELLWSQWHGSAVCPLLLDADSKGISLEKCV